MCRKHANTVRGRTYPTVMMIKNKVVVRKHTGDTPLPSPPQRSSRRQGALPSTTGNRLDSSGQDLTGFTGSKHLGWLEE